jgi:hypothetical protein
MVDLLITLASLTSPAAVAAPQQRFCSCIGTANCYLRQPRRTFSFAHRGWVDLINTQFSNPASRSAQMPAAFSMAVAWGELNDLDTRWTNP